MFRSVRKNLTLLVWGAALATTVSGCSGLGRALSDGKNPPDEFAIATKAPLVVPPDYSLRPPRPGEQRPQEQSPSERARLALLGDASAAPPTLGEQVLIQNAGALTANPNIRDLLAQENGARAKKNDGLANQLMFWEFFGDKVDDARAPLRVNNTEEWLSQRDEAIKAVIGEDGEVEIGGGEALILPGVY
ncbi:MAG: DUF3035 domain-containing protein [Pseudomonadota bacterium]